MRLNPELEAPLPPDYNSALEEILELRRRLIRSQEQLASMYEKRMLEAQSYKGQIRWMDKRIKELTPKEGDKCQCQYEAGDSPCKTHGDEV